MAYFNPRDYFLTLQEWIRYGCDITWDNYSIMKNHGDYVQLMFPSSAAKGQDTYEGRAKWLKEHNPNGDVDEEIVAESMFDALSNETTVKELLKTENRTFFEKVRDWIDEFIGYIDETIQRLKGKKQAGAEIRSLQKQTDVLKKASDLFYQGLENTKNVGNTKEIGDDVRYSVKEFAEQVDQIEEGTFPRGNHVYVGATPKILADVGLNGNLPMLTTAQHVRKALLPKNDKTHQHGLTETQLKALPQKIANPVMIMDSLDPRRNAVIVVTDMLDADGSPIIAAIKADGRGMFNDVEVDTNFVLSYYGRDGFNNFIDKNISADTFLYIDKTKSRSLSNQAKRQFFGKLDKYDFDIIIRKTNANVNVLNSGNISKNKEQAQYADNVNKFSVKDVENYSETEYNQYGWVVVNDVLSRTEYRKLNEQFAAIAHGEKFERTRDGYYVIPVGEDDRPQNAFVFIKGTISKPVIGKIMIIDVKNEMELDRISLLDVMTMIIRHSGRSI